MHNTEIEETIVAEELTIQLPNFKLGGLRWGTGNPQKILALHGWLDNAASFTHLAPLLAQQGSDVVAIDLPGHGNSQHRPQGVTYHLVDYLREVHLVLDALRWQQPILLGHSLGGIVASMLCAAAPQRIDKLIMLESLGPIASKPGDFSANLHNALSKVLRDFSAKKIYATIDAAASDRMNGFGKISKEAARILVQRNLSPAESGWVWKTDSRLLWPSFIRLTEPQVQAYLASLSLPLQVIAAADGYVSLDPDKNTRLTCLTSARKDLAEGGHHFHLDGEVDKIALCIKEFLNNSD